MRYLTDCAMRFLAACILATVAGFMVAFSAVYVFAIVLASIIAASAHDAREHPALVGWAEEQLITRQHGARYGGATGSVCPVPDPSNVQCRCCDNSEIVSAEYRLSKTVDARGYQIDEYWYKRAGSDVWKLIPDDVVHWNEHAPDGRAVLFVIATDVERCFFPPRTDQ